MNDPMMEIAETLGEAYAGRAKLRNSIREIEKWITARELELTPPTGWEGKNSEQRDQARDKAWATDKTMMELTLKLDAALRQQEVLEASILAMETERRAREWSIRGRLVDALARLGMRASGDQTFEGPAFDEPADLAMINAALEMGAEVTDGGSDGLPF